MEDSRFDLIPGSESLVSVAEFEGKPMLKVAPEALSILAENAFREVEYKLRPAHNAKVAAILSDPEASENDRFVALSLLRNAAVASKCRLPLCQDTGTAIIYGWKGQQVWTGGGDAAALSEGVKRVFAMEPFRYSQNAPLSTYKEVKTGNNLPAQIELEAVDGMEYCFLCVAKGGGSANKTQLFQETRAILSPEKLVPFLSDKIKTLGTSACPPYHIAIVIGGTSAEMNLKTAKLASCGYYDGLPSFQAAADFPSENCATLGNIRGRGPRLAVGGVRAADILRGDVRCYETTELAFRDTELEAILLKEARKSGIGAQFGGVALAHDIRVIRLPRHGASCPIGLAVSCSADRNIKCRIDSCGVWLERLDSNPERLIPAGTETASKGVEINLDRPMAEILADLRKYPVGTRLSLTGTIILARDIAHARIAERLDKGGEMPAYLKEHPVLYAGPTKTPEGLPCGSIGPTTAGRMDSYVERFQSLGGSLVMIAKGQRSAQVAESCKRYGGFYLGITGGTAALFASENVESLECLEFPELGMEAVWQIRVKSLPAFILIDDKGYI